MSKMMKGFATASVLAASALASVAAQAEFTGNVGVTSNYIWRGVTQTDDMSAIQGGLDFAHDSGLYAGTWVSNVDFGASGEYEMDFYAGFAGEIGDFGYDLAILNYAYPLTDDADFTELGASVSYGPVTAGVNYTISSDIEDTAAPGEVFIEGDIYYYLSAGFDIAEGLSLGATVGNYDFEDDGTDDYSHIQVSLTKSTDDFGDFTFAVDSADLDDMGNSEDDPRVSVAWTKSFDLM